MKGLLFTFALSYGGAVVSLFRPWYGLLIYIAFAILRPEMLWHWSVPQGGNYSRIVAIGLLIGWAIHGFGRWDFGKATATVVALIGFWLWGIVSALNAVADSSMAFMQVEEYAKVLLPFLVGMTSIKTDKQVKQLAWVIVLCQGYLAYEFNLTYYTSPFFNPNEWRFGGLDRNGIAITMVTSAGLALFLGLNSARFLPRWLCFCLAGLMVHVVLFSLSRGGMLAVLITGAVSFFLIEKRPKHLVLFGLGIAIGISLAGPQVVERFKTTFKDEAERDYSAESRLDLWKACVRVMMDYSVTGIGLQNWRLVAHRYGFTQGKDAHTMWLHVGAEMGIVGLAFLVAFYGFTAGKLWWLIRSKTRKPNSWNIAVGQMVISAIFAFAVSAQFVSAHGVELPYYICLLGAGALMVNSRQAKQAATVPVMVPVSNLHMASTRAH